MISGVIQLLLQLPALHRIEAITQMALALAGNGRAAGDETAIMPALFGVSWRKLVY